MNQLVTLRRLHGDEAMAMVEPLADLLADCVESGASIGFMLPLAREKVRAFWQGVAAAVARHERVLLVAEDGVGRLVGTVQLVLSLPENQAHRADVAKMLVHRDARRQGIAQRLMGAIDDEARAQGRSLLVLDTETGGNAERLYEREGWQRVGVVPNYARMPDGGPCSATIFYKPL